MLHKLNAQLIELSNIVSAAILNGEYKLLKRGEYTIHILVQSMKVEMWNSNTPKHTRVYALQTPEWYIMDMELPFLEPEKCREILNQMTEEEILAEQKELQDKIIKLQERLK